MLQNNTDNPLVTVVMPTYNSAAYVAAAIQSVLDQTYRPIHLLIGDDASTDGTQEIIKSFAEQYPDIIEAIYNPVNLGVAGNVNFLYTRFKGRYISWFAGDDLFYSNKIELQISALKNDPEAIFCYHDVDVIDQDGQFLFRYNDEVLGQKAWTTSIAENLMRHRCFISGLSLVIDSARAGQIRHRYECGPCADWLLCFELAAHGKAIYINQPLAAYRRHAGNITRKAEITWEDVIYDYAALHYPAYKNSIQDGRLALYQQYIFKYAVRRQWKKFFRSSGTFLKLLMTNPHRIIFVAYMLFKEIKKRTILRIKIGRLSS